MARKPPSPPPAQPSTHIRRERLARQWTQEELSKRVSEVVGDKVTAITISRWENDRRNLTVVELAAVAKAFGVEPRALLPGSDGLDEDERHLLATWREALPHERSAIQGLTRALHDSRPAEISHRPAVTPQSRRGA